MKATERCPIPLIPFPLLQRDVILHDVLNKVATTRIIIWNLSRDTKEIRRKQVSNIICIAQIEETKYYDFLSNSYFAQVTREDNFTYSGLHKQRNSS